MSSVISTQPQFLNHVVMQDHYKDFKVSLFFCLNHWEPVEKQEFLTHYRGDVRYANRISVKYLLCIFTFYVVMQLWSSGRCRVTVYGAKLI